MYLWFIPHHPRVFYHISRFSATSIFYLGEVLAIFLNWLDDHSTSFEAATNHHVRQFLQHLVFGHLQDEKILSVQSTISSSTLKSYITVITSFYRWLDEINQTEMLWHSKSIRANKFFLYGQIYNYEYSYLVDGYVAMLVLS